LQLLSSSGYDPALAHEFDLKALEEELSQPLTFSRWNCLFHCDAADVKVLRRYRDESLSRGRPNLGWCVDVRIGQFYFRSSLSVRLECIVGVTR
jgi:hypothetical protein